LGAHSGRAIITTCGLPLAKVSFSLTVQSSDIGADERRKSLKASERKLRSAFASYSSTHMRRMFAKLRVSSRAAMVAEMMGAGMFMHTDDLRKMSKSL